MQPANLEPIIEAEGGAKTLWLIIVVPIIFLVLGYFFSFVDKLPWNRE